MKNPAQYEAMASRLDAAPVRGFEPVEVAFPTAPTDLPAEPLEHHPLAHFVDVDGEVRPPRWVVPGVVPEGLTLISGAPGVGKTSALLPLTLTVAGLHGGELRPRQWRHVVYVSEDTEQAKRILAGITNFSGLNIDREDLRERFHLVEAVRLSPEKVASVGKTYREKFTRDVGGVLVPPLVVLDTKSAVLAVQNENDNAEQGAMIATLKQGFDGLPVWLVGHVAKSPPTRSEALSSRGAGALDGDANHTMFLVKDGLKRYLVQGKTRFSPRWPELEIESHSAETIAPDVFGNMETVFLNWGTALPPEKPRGEAVQEAVERERKEADARLRENIRNAVETAWRTGNPLNRGGVKAQLGGKGETVGRMVENLLNERWLIEVPVPAPVRTHHNRKDFLVNLSTAEHEAVRAGGDVPSEKTTIPASWRKSGVSSIPAQEVKPPTA